LFERGSNGKGLDLGSLKFEAVAKCGDPKMLDDIMKSFLRTKDVNTMDCALDGVQVFGSTKQKLDMPPTVNCDFH
jgi:hypothetical protein